MAPHTQRGHPKNERQVYLNKLLHKWDLRDESYEIFFNKMAYKW